MSKDRSKKLTPAMIRAMEAVRAGKVRQQFTPHGNSYQGPGGIAPSCYRRLEALKYIEDVPGQTSTGVYASHFKQMLSPAGVAALDAHNSCKGEGS